jgi:hypothetical protein
MIKGDSDIFELLPLFIGDKQMIHLKNILVTGGMGFIGSNFVLYAKNVPDYCNAIPIIMDSKRLEQRLHIF